jgi:hypothetical protein
MNQYLIDYTNLVEEVSVLSDMSSVSKDYCIILGREAGSQLRRSISTITRIVLQIYIKPRASRISLHHFRVFLMADYPVSWSE